MEIKANELKLGDRFKNIKFGGGIFIVTELPNSTNGYKLIGVSENGLIAIQSIYGPVYSTSNCWFWDTGLDTIVEKLEPKP